MLGSLGVPELLFIFGLALLVFGPKRLPEIGRAIGKGMAELRKASTDLKRTLNAEMIQQEMRDADPRRAVRDSLRDVKKSLTDVVDVNEPAPSAPPAEPVQVEGSVARTPRRAAAEAAPADASADASAASPSGVAAGPDSPDGGQP